MTENIAVLISFYGVVVLPSFKLYLPFGTSEEFQRNVRRIKNIYKIEGNREELIPSILGHKWTDAEFFKSVPQIRVRNIIYTLNRMKGVNVSFVANVRTKRKDLAADWVDKHFPNVKQIFFGYKEVESPLDTKVWAFEELSKDYDAVVVLDDDYYTASIMAVGFPHVTGAFMLLDRPYNRGRSWSTTDKNVTIPTRIGRWEENFMDLNQVTDTVKAFKTRFESLKT